MNFQIAQADETMEMIKDIICTVAYDYVNSKSDDTDFFNKMYYLMERYNDIMQQKAMLLYGKEEERAVNEATES